MVTKRQYAKHNALIEARAALDKHDLFDLNELTDDQISLIAMQSTTFGVCMQFLGYITEDKYPDLMKYLNERGGIVIVSYDPIMKESYSLSVREMLDLLPDKL